MYVKSTPRYYIVKYHIHILLYLYVFNIGEILAVQFRIDLT